MKDPVRALSELAESRQTSRALGGPGSGPHKGAGKTEQPHVGQGTAHTPSQEVQNYKASTDKAYAAHMKANQATAKAQAKNTPEAHRVAAVAHSKASNATARAGMMNTSDKHNEQSRAHSVQAAQLINSGHKG